MAIKKGQFPNKRITDKTHLVSDKLKIKKRVSPTVTSKKTPLENTFATKCIDFKASSVQYKKCFKRSDSF